YVEFNTTNQATVDGEGKSQAPAIQFRYADILLNYAEALAELDGAGNAAKIAEALNPLRSRVGMPGVDFDREYNTDASYPFRSLNKYIQAVRRERRVEKALEGRRLEDILRWAAADLLIKGQTPKGALFIGSNLKDAYSTLVYDQPSGNNLYLSGKPGDERRYIIPFNNTSYANGWNFNLDRDYLLPIQPRMISLTDGMWTQNPGW
ncbi:MAG: RagB/SusD family nutrient uptake outer membrane protein, partial [Tannerellaceae bacterium]